MTMQLLTLLGGIGLFLFGMQTMTAALRQLASSRARRFLARFTTTPLAGVMTGAVTTAAIQSSSATVMTVIGFVGAGLLTFPQAIGVIFGANIGTTTTGWMVAILGLKLHLGTIALPVVLAGALLSALARGRLALAGTTVVGFSLMFLGLDMMQSGTEAIGPLVTRALVSADSLAGRVYLVAIGALVTVIVQSSSAGVAAALVLLHGGAIDLLQAAALIIGMDIGTTAKSVIATLGGSRDMRRTALAHVGYNLVTAVFAFAVIGLVPLLRAFTAGDDATALVVFHTLFNVAGIFLMLPFITSFAGFIERLVPRGGGPLPEPLDRRLLAEPRSALDAARVASGQISSVVFSNLAAEIETGSDDGFDDDLHRSLEDMEEYLTELAIPIDAEGPRNRLSALLHMTDHMHRLVHRSTQTERMAALRREPSLRRPAAALAAALRLAAETPADAVLAQRLARLHRLTAGRTARLRRSALLREHVGLVGPRDIFDLTDALRWLERVFRHAERIVHYGAVAAQEEPTRAEASREDARA